MFFWIIFTLIIFIMAVLSMYSTKGLSVFISKLIILILTMVSSFRYMIGVDYSEYINMYYNANISIIRMYPEISFTMISELLKSLGFSFQVLFICYSVIISFFLYKGLDFFLDNKKNIGFALAFFTYSLFCGYWESMNTIRQMAAVSVCFYACKYLYLKKYDIWFGLSFLGFLLHYSGIVFLLGYFFQLSMKKRIVYAGILLASLMAGLFNISGIFYYILELIGRGTSYVNLAYQFTGSGLGVVYFLIMYFFVLLIVDLENQKIHFCFNMYSLGMIIYLIFLSNNPVLLRFSFYYLFFQYVVVSDTVLRVKPHKLVAFCMLIVLSLMSLYKISTIPYNVAQLNNPRVSARNMEYRVNLKLFD